MGQARLSDYIQGQAPPGTTSVWPWGVQRRMGSKVTPMSTLCGGGGTLQTSVQSIRGSDPPPRARLPAESKAFWTLETRLHRSTYRRP